MLYPARPPNVILKGPAEIAGLAAAGKLASQCLQWIIEQVQPGMSTQDIDDLQMQFAKQHKVRPAPLNYKGFPKSICTSVNEVICHGIPNKRQVLRDGDIVGIDVTLIVDGFHGDNAATITVGKASPEAVRIVAAALESNRRGILAAGHPKARIGDIGHAIQSYAEPLGYSVVTDFVGHGIGRVFHEEPQIPHYGRPKTGLRIRPGMTFTVEPMINAGVPDAVVLRDGWTAVTKDGKLSAQFEHTIVRTEEGIRVLTVQNDKGEWEPPGRWTPPIPPP